MTATQSRLLGFALLLAAIAFVVFLAKGSDAVDASATTPDALARKQQLEEATAKLRARFDSGAYIQRTKQLSDREELEVIVIPEGYTEELDTRCIVYRNLELKTSSMTCSGILFRQAAS